MLFFPQRKNPAIGAKAELCAETYLKNKGLRLIRRNFHAKTGEIDLIMRDRSTLVFIEVKARKSAEHGYPAEFVTRSKQKKIIRTAMVFLQKHPEMTELPCRFDVLSILATASTYDWIPDAFQV